MQVAVAEGHKVIHVAAGTHNVASINEAVTFILYQGTHTFTNAPVTSTVPYNMVAAIGRGPDHRYVSTGSVYIAASAQDVFRISDGETDLYGGSFVGLRFNPANLSRSAVWTQNLSGMIIRDCAFTKTSGATFEVLFYATGTTGHEIRDWVIDSNQVSRLCLGRLTGAATFHDWNIGQNFGAGGTDNNSVPWIDVYSDAYGFTYAGDSYELGTAGADDTTPAGHINFRGLVQQSRFMALQSEGMQRTPDNAKLRAPDARSCYFQNDRGHWAQNGEFVVNGTVLNTGRDTTDGKFSRLVIQDRGVAF
jgi:hypothetical protein